MKRKNINSSRVPVYRDAGFEFPDAGSIKDAFISETDNERVPEMYIYSRYRNPTVVSAEEEIMKLEECNWALLTQSGMSAIDTSLSLFQRGRETRSWLFFNEIYGGTISYIESILKTRRGVDVHNFFPEGEKYDMASFDRIMDELKPEVVYVEAISNPMLIITDLDHVIHKAHSYDAKVIVDNTFATPALCRPLGAGADIVIHSATKYFSGHGNITAGAICGNDDAIMKQALEYRKFVGHMISPDDAYRLNTQIRTFGLRFRQQCTNAVSLTNLFLAAGDICKVWYPGIKDHPTHNEAVKLFADRGFGAMLTFDFAGDTPGEKRKRRDIFIETVSDHIKIIPSLGDPLTIIMPVESVWSAKYPEPGIIRLSAGFEDTDLLLKVVTEALDKVSSIREL